MWKLFLWNHSCHDPTILGSDSASKHTSVQQQQVAAIAPQKVIIKKLALFLLNIICSQMCWLSLHINLYVDETVNSDFWGFRVYVSMKVSCRMTRCSFASAGQYRTVTISHWNLILACSVKVAFGARLCCNFVWMLMVSRGGSPPHTHSFPLDLNFVRWGGSSSIMDALKAFLLYHHRAKISTLYTQYLLMFSAKCPGISWVQPRSSAAAPVGSRDLDPRLVFYNIRLSCCSCLFSLLLPF